MLFRDLGAAQFLFEADELLPFHFRIHRSSAADRRLQLLLNVRAAKTELKAHEDTACICKRQKKRRGLRQVTLMRRNDSFGSFDSQK